MRRSCKNEKIFKILLRIRDQYVKNIKFLRSVIYFSYSLVININRLAREQSLRKLRSEKQNENYDALQYFHKGSQLHEFSNQPSFSVDIKQTSIFEFWKEWKSYRVRGLRKAGTNFKGSSANDIEKWSRSTEEKSSCLLSSVPSEKKPFSLIFTAFSKNWRHERHFDIYFIWYIKYFNFSFTY